MTFLLPKSSAEEFQLKEYWDSFFSKRTSSFEWYGDYIDLCHILHKYLKPSCKILMAGCGNSKLSEDLYDAGFNSIDNIDISDIVIRQMRSKNQVKRKEMTFSKMDILDMSFDDSAYDCVLDKGTLDAIFSNNDDVTVQKVTRMFDEIKRVIKVTGRYICITLAQEHILTNLLKYFECGWLLRVHKVKLEVNKDSEMVGGALPVFVFVCTKMAHREGQSPIKVYEYVNDDGKCVRCSGVEKVGDFVRDNQQYAMIEQHYSKLHIGESAFQIDLWSPSVEEEPRYSLTVVDLNKRKATNGRFAVFIVPHGREIDWLFSSDSGRLQLAESAGFERLVVVTMHRGHIYPSLAEVKEEVSARAVELLQKGLPHGKQYPVLSLGDGLGSRVVLHEGCSALSGKYVVEECSGQEGTDRVRALIFLNSSGLAQTEMKVISSASKKKRITSTKLDHSHLVFGHHKAMVSSIAFLPQMFSDGDYKEDHIRLLLVGLGGGALPIFISKHLKKVMMDVVELDSEMVSVAEKWFGFSQGKNIKVFIDDGIHFIKEACSRKKGSYDMILLDVDSKDASVGMSSPPDVFLNKDFLESCKSLLTSSGILVTNLAARDKSMRTKAMNSLHECFSTLLSMTISEDVNEVITCIPEARHRPYLIAEAEGSEKLTGNVKCNIFNDCQNIKNGLAQLCTEAASSGEIKADILQSELLDCISEMCYEQSV